jgi:hypothetical protein
VGWCFHEYCWFRCSVAIGSGGANGVGAVSGKEAGTEGMTGAGTVPLGVDLESDAGLGEAESWVEAEDAVTEAAAEDEVDAEGAGVEAAEPAVH